MAWKKPISSATGFIKSLISGSETVPANQQMIVYDQLQVTGTLTVNGKVVVIPHGIIS